MNLEHAVHTLTECGLTDRQARFLVLVARHSGVCVMRQYSSFASIDFGQKTRKFFSPSSCSSDSSRPTTAPTIAAASITCAIG